MGTEATAAKRRLDRAAVVAAARDLLDEEGVDGLSMAKLGERLDVTGMALYRHVTDRSDLVAAVVELVLADLVAPADDDADWADALAGWMHAVRQRWLAHPWLGSMLGTSTQLSPPWLAALDRLTAILASAGLPPDTVAKELVRIGRTTVGVLIQETGAPLPHAGITDEALAVLPPDARARWRPIAKALRRYDNDDLFADVVADTIARVRAERPTEA